jgi:hypothetical protein
MFKELPAWGFYVRHTKGITFENVILICAKADYRTAVVLDDVSGASFKPLKVTEPGNRKETIFSRNAPGLTIEK